MRELGTMKGIVFDPKIAPLSFIDLEMSGLEGSKHEIVEVGLVKVSQPELEIIETWEAKVRPEHLENADPTALKISGYNEKGWRDAISLKEMMSALASKIEGTILIGSNISCDYAFLDAAVTKTGIALNFYRRVLDVNSFAYGKGYDIGALGVSSLSKKLGIESVGRHTALPDAMATYQIYKKLVLS